ncbi:MAG: hypothetical protein KGQ40_11910, partial [Rhodospirillales bacterium]|nr:hypothetical protein [Rhodospirillales bacterium]
MPPRILLLALSDWFGPGRLPKMLRDAGFEVAIMAETGAMLAQSSHVDYRFPLSAERLRLGVLGPLFATILDYNPRFVLPCDEAAALLLQAVAVSFDGVRGPGAMLRVMVPERVREVLLRSLGDSRSFSLRGNRVGARRAAALMHIATPASQAVPYLQVAEAFAETHGWPVVLTRSGRTGGERVRICADAAALRDAYSSLTAPAPSAGPMHGLRRLVWGLAGGLRLAGDLTLPPQDGASLWIEEHIPGHPATYSFTAHEGRVLAGFAAIAETVQPATGIACQVRLEPDRAMAEAAQLMVGRMVFTGLGGLHFVRRPDGRPCFLKFSPRPTALSHLGPLAGADLAAALMAAATNTPAAPVAPPAPVSVT